MHISMLVCVCSLFLQDGQLVVFSEVGGMAELNNHKPIRIKNCKVCATPSSSHSSCSHSNRWAWHAGAPLLLPALADSMQPCYPAVQPCVLQRNLVGLLHSTTSSVLDPNAHKL